MRRFPLPTIAVLAWLAGSILACGSTARTRRSYDQIRSEVAGKSAAQVESLLGPPDSRILFTVGDERWTWWNFTYLDGQDYAPEVRGRVVHLSITFENPDPTARPRRPYSEWKIVDRFGINYLLPGKKE